jgi:hypothetical protein
MRCKIVVFLADRKAPCKGEKEAHARERISGSAAAGVAATVRAAYPSCHPDDKIA